MKTYKGFDKNLQCRDFQFEIGKEYEAEGRIKTCENGFHACKVPLDVLTYYAPGDSRYCEVEQSGTLSKYDNDSKVASKKIKIGAEIGIPGLIKAQVEYVKNACENASKKVAQDDYSHAAAQGDYGHVATQDDYSHAVAQGDYGHVATQGYRGYAVTQGDYGHAVTQGDSGHAATQGYRSHAVTQGDYGHAVAQGSCGYAVAQGDYGHAVTQGDRGHASVEGKDAIACACGIGGYACAALGSWIVCAEWECKNGWHIKAVKAAQIDGETLKPDTWYTLKNGKFIEV